MYSPRSASLLRWRPPRPPPPGKVMEEEEVEDFCLNLSPPFSAASRRPSERGRRWDRDSASGGAHTFSEPSHRARPLHFLVQRQRRERGTLSLKMKAFLTRSLFGRQRWRIWGLVMVQCACKRRDGRPEDIMINTRPEEVTSLHKRRPLTGHWRCGNGLSSSAEMGME